VTEKTNVYSGPDHWYLSPLYAGMHEYQIERLSEIIEQGARVLDVGCGDGRTTFLLSCLRLSPRVIGIDIQAIALRFARLMTETRSVSLPFVQADALRLPFRSSSFDCVTMFDVIEHLPREVVPDLLLETRRVLRSDGRVVITTPNRRSLRNRVRGHRLNDKHYFEVEARELRRLVSPMFRVDNVEGVYIPVPLPGLEGVAKLRHAQRVVHTLIRAGRRWPELAERLMLWATPGP
jgi:ubiquinone/menaquinone biosynthesis C-methylase UbiE